MSCIRFQLHQRQLRFLIVLLPLVLAHALKGQTVENIVGIAERLNWPSAVALDAKGAVIFVERLNYRVRRVEPDGTLSTVAGNGCVGAGFGQGCFSGDGGPARLAAISSAYGLASDSVGNLFLADSGNSRIRRIDSSGIITTIAGDGQTAYSGGDGAALNASLSDPRGVAVDALGNLYIADSGNNRIRKVTPNGVISTIAGTGVAGFSNDGGPATSAALNWPTGLCLDLGGNLYIAERGNNRVRKVSPSGIITTYAGNGTPRSAGDGLRATDASLNDPSAVAADGRGGIYIAETAGSSLNGRIRRVGSNGIIMSVGVSVKNPRSLTVDGSGNLLIADSYQSSIVMVSFKLTDTPVNIVSINAAGGGSDVAQNTWIEIKGTGLAPNSIGSSGFSWSTAPEFASNKMPTQLQGVSVKVNNKPAYVYWISPTQVNVLTPLDNTQGTVQVQLINGSNTSPPFTVNMRALAPAFLFSLSNGKKYVVGQHNDYSLIGPAVMSVSGYSFRPAKPGESIVLYASGFGLPETTLVGGSATQFGALPAPLPAVRIGGVPAMVSFAGVIAPGLYQLNVVVPSSDNGYGDNTITASYAGFTTPVGAVIPVQP